MIWEPSKESIENTNVKQFMDKLKIDSYGELVRKSTEDISWWWSTCEKKLGVEWFHDYSKTLDTSLGVERTTWFPNGSLNLTHNSLDRNNKAMGSSTALIWQGEDGSERKYTYGELSRETNMFCNYLSGIGVQKGDVVASCLPMMPEAIVAMLATIKIGGVFSPIFAGYGPEAIASRLSDAKPRLLITCDGYYRRNNKINLKPNVDESLKVSDLETKVLVVERFERSDAITKSGQESYKIIRSESASCEAEPMSADDPALLLYTSGTTGKPKGAVLSHAGALLQPSKELFFNLDTKPGDVFMWITDIGWMMGPWQIIGAQHLGATHVIFEGVPDFPTPNRIWSMIGKYGITHLGHSATTIRMLRRHGDEMIKGHDLSSLRVLGNTGEPIDPDTWLWEMNVLGDWKCPMINLSGGTEIFGCFLMPSPVVPLKPSTLWGPGLGMDVDVFDELGKSVRTHVGYLVCKKPAPSMTRGFWQNFDRYIETYWNTFPGVWYHGDWALVDADGYWFLHGRADDVIKVAGRRIGPAEIESVLSSHPAIAESACVGLPDEVKGEKLYCFVLLKQGVRHDDTEQIKASAKALIVQKLGKTLEPDKIVIVNDLPRTRSGKIIRRLIRSIVVGYDSAATDISTLENPESLEIIRADMTSS